MRIAVLIAAAVMSSLMPAQAQAETAVGLDWVAQSNLNADVLLQTMARYEPETAAELGVDGYDTDIVDLGPQRYERERGATQAAVAVLEARKRRTLSPAVIQDLDILIKAGNDQLESARLQHELMLPYYNVAETVFQGIHSLLDPRIPPERQAAAVERLRRYAGIGEGAQSICELAKTRTAERMKVEGLVGPYRGELEQNLADSPRLIEGLTELFEASGLDGYQEPLAALQQQLRDYDGWVSRVVLPRARNDHRLPQALYADNLKQFGVDVEPQELIRRALVSFAEIRNEMQALAQLVAQVMKLDARDYRDVIRILKQQQIEGDAILPLYRERLAEIEKRIQSAKIVSLPQREAVIRLASEAESAIIPAPHMSPPRLIGNSGEYGEFVLPLNVPGKEGQADLKTDDFTFDAASWTLTAHEARPGHELQFAAMLEKGVTIARAVFAFNSVNVEGWALYAEAEMKPTLPLDGQLIALQHRLMRAARAFLDPMVNLGELTPEQVKQFLMDEVVLSEGMAQQEVDRYTFRAPGQATSYFVGYQALMALRQRTQLALGSRFDRLAFNDFILAQGLLPPALLQQAVMTEFVPAQKARSSTAAP
ncbi:DUF885 domain-containing protein [Sinimarinibacterium sp. CAU 1509]|uniref:DUF885 domain-containing protein n=1 Tax=Sinimarinibacterium sp. CAU 1509 TaxID=2562283 RepID=UPI0010ABFD27|nr:DUF885 domain-containing protein [Sinimarinibacterium sp. CAU 1509]TJY60963.1 DUF885 domain-containing protein [Sinimarinibacterium sp. CAU 1509]